MPDVIEIRDPAIDQEAVRQQVQAQVTQRRAAGGYGPDPTTLGPDSLRPGTIAARATGSTSPAFPGLSQALIELIGRGTLRETQFTSSVPVVGPLIAAVRRAWNWMSTRWYVLPLMRQQSEINAQTGTLLNEMAQWQELMAERLEELQARVAELEEQIRASDTLEKAA